MEVESVVLLVLIVAMWSFLAGAFYAGEDK